VVRDEGFREGSQIGRREKDGGVIDTHCHIDLYKQPFDVAKLSEAGKICTVAVTHLPSHYQIAEQHLKGFRYVRPALGLHPLSVNDHAAEMALFKRLVTGANLIGEIGLDFSSQALSTRSLQEESFAAVLDSLRERRRFVTLHSRRAEDAVLSHLRAAGVENAVFHWFSGTRPQLVKILDGGHFVSINAGMIATKKWNELIRIVPQDRVLTESDGPFVQFNGKPALPTSISTVIHWLSEKWSESLGLIEERVQQTFDRLAGEVFPVDDSKRSMGLPVNTC
jgi:TatD DNase family protein